MGRVRGRERARKAAGLGCAGGAQGAQPTPRLRRQASWRSWGQGSGFQTSLRLWHAPASRLAARSQSSPHLGLEARVLGRSG